MYVTYSNRSPEFTNKRHYTREAVYIHAQWWSCDGSGEELPVLITELSEGGVSLLGDLMTQPGASATLRFQLPQSRQRIDCEILNAWSSPYDGRSGWQFRSIEGDGSSLLKQWLGSFRCPLGRPVIPDELYGK
jgi:hypothetical protein